MFWNDQRESISSVLLNVEGEACELVFKTNGEADAEVHTQVSSVSIWSLVSCVDMSSLSHTHTL